ncbi:MAG: 5'/3'-nucleotidase SurE [Verrucomicrobia bacterium]|jgi:5'-nucleotidase|nr:5'/3'-nucleotidase SurE [Verrucomicrobiota bacterium]
MRILIANDDGIYSPGIVALAEVAGRFGEVRIVAPDVEQSSMGHAITANRPLHYRRTPVKGFEAFRVNGTPADCVALGLHQWGGADLVLSGINLGVNLGSGIWHSGTLAAAKQAVFSGARGIAFSTPVENDVPEFEKLQPHVENVMKVLTKYPSLQLVNVNLPAEPRGMRWTRQSVRQYDGRMVEATDPMGREIYWFTVVPIKEAEEGTDRWAIENGWISVTPIRIDLTNDAELAKLAAAQAG